MAAKPARKPAPVAEPPRPQIELFYPQTTPKSWGNEVLVAEWCGSAVTSIGYTGKVLHRIGREPYHRAGLQYHTAKDETFYLFSGMAWVLFVRDGQVYKFLLQADRNPPSVHVPAGAIHSVQTQGNSVMFEAAEYAPDSETIRVEDDYSVVDAIEIQPERL